MEDTQGWSREVLDALAAPFDPELVEWKAQATTQDKNRCLAVGYVDMRHYMARLDEVFPGQWGHTTEITTVPPASGGWAGCVIVATRLYVGNLARSGEGEAPLSGEQNSVTSATAQSFKRACVAYGIGAYLYQLPQAWVNYDKQKKRIPDADQHKLRQALYGHNRKLLAARQSNGNGDEPPPKAEPKAKQDKPPDKEPPDTTGPRDPGDVPVPTSPPAVMHTVNTMLGNQGVEFQYSSISAVLRGAQQIAGESKFKGWPPDPRGDDEIIAKWHSLTAAAITYGQQAPTGDKPENGDEETLPF